MNISPRFALFFSLAVISIGCKTRNFNVSAFEISNRALGDGETHVLPGEFSIAVFSRKADFSFGRRLCNKSIERMTLSEIPKSSCGDVSWLNSETIMDYAENSLDKKKYEGGRLLKRSVGDLAEKKEVVFRAMDLFNTNAVEAKLNPQERKDLYEEFKLQMRPWFQDILGYQGGPEFLKSFMISETDIAMLNDLLKEQKEAQETVDFESLSGLTFEQFKTRLNSTFETLKLDPAMSAIASFLPSQTIDTLRVINDAFNFNTSQGSLPKDWLNDLTVLQVGAAGKATLKTKIIPLLRIFAKQTPLEWNQKTLIEEKELNKQIQERKYFSNELLTDTKSTVLAYTGVLYFDENQFTEVTSEDDLSAIKEESNFGCFARFSDFLLSNGWNPAPKAYGSSSFLMFTSSTSFATKPALTKNREFPALLSHTSPPFRTSVYIKCGRPRDFKTGQFYPLAAMKWPQFREFWSKKRRIIFPGNKMKTLNHSLPLYSLPSLKFDLQ